MTQRYMPYTGNFSTYGQGPEHRFFGPADSQPQVPQGGGLTAQTPSSTPIPVVQQQTNTPLFHAPAADSSFTGNIGFPNQHLAQPAVDANSGQAAAASAGNPSVAPGAAWSGDPMRTQPGVDYSGSLAPQVGSTLGSTIGGVAGRVAGSMIGSGLGPIGSIGLGYGLGKLGSYLGSNFDSPGYGGDSGMSDNGGGGFGSSQGFSPGPGFGTAGAFGPEGGIGGGGGMAAGTDSLTGPGGMGGNFGGTPSDSGSDGSTGDGSSGNVGGGFGGGFGGSDPTGGGGLGSPSSTSSLGSMGGGFGSSGGFGSGGGGDGGDGGGGDGGGGGGSGGGSGRVICTELYRRGLIPADLWIADIVFTHRNVSPVTVRGYQWWGVPAVLLMRRSPLLTRFLLVAMARPRAEELAYRMGKRDRPNYYGKLVRWVMEPVCWVIGSMVGQVDYDAKLYRSR